ncbi:hypothetical protein AT251_21600 [Enterovibrio nigricans]|nr:hypothetical protein AT251_21600 [Enterovibrio nigricans]
MIIGYTLWAVFQHNRWLLNNLFACAAKVFLAWVHTQDVDVGVFCALHTYGRRLNWNVHIHLSVTRGGLCRKQGSWNPVFFKAKPTELCWRTAVIRLLRPPDTGFRWCAFHPS